MYLLLSMFLDDADAIVLAVENVDGLTCGLSVTGIEKPPSRLLRIAIINIKNKLRKDKKIFFCIVFTLKTLKGEEAILKV